MAKPSDIYTRIKMYARAYQVDTTELDNEVLTSIYRTAYVNEWALVQEKFKAISEGRK